MAPATAEITSSHINLVYSAALRQTHNPDLASDITQAVFLVWARKQAAGKPPAVRYLTAWLLKVTAYAVKESRCTTAARSRHEHQAALEKKEANMPPHPPDPHLLEALDASLLHLHTKDREVIARRYLEGQSITQIASALAIPENTAGRRISRALEKLRRHLASKGILTPAATLTAALTTQSLLAAPAATMAAISASIASTTVANVVKGILHRVLVVKCQQVALITAGLLVTTIAIAIGVRTVTSLTLNPSAIASTPPASATTGPQSGAEWAMQAGDESLDIVALVNEVRAKESWVYSLKSMQIAMEGRWTKTPQGLEMRRQEAVSRAQAGQAITPENFPELRQVEPERLLVAFDDKRMRSEYVIEGRYHQVTVWDGAQATGYSGPETPGAGSIQFIGKDALHILNDFQSHLGSWPRSGPHEFWFDKKPADDFEISYGKAEGFRLLGRAAVENIPCYVLEYEQAIGWGNFIRWYVGVKDHFMHRLVLGYRIEMPKPEALIALAREHGGRSENMEEAIKHLQQLPPDELRKIRSDPRLSDGAKHVERLSSDHYYLDYFEVKAGSWMPRKIGYLLYEDPPHERNMPPGDPILVSRRELEIKEVRLDAELPASLFQLELVEGVTLQDQTHQPIHEYVYKENNLPEDLKKIEDKARQSHRKLP